MGANYSCGVWEGFAHQANTILRTFENDRKSRSVNNFLQPLDLDPNRIKYLSNVLTQSLRVNFIYSNSFIAFFLF